MILTIDVGNSDIVTVLFDKDKNILNYDRRETIKKNKLEDYENYLKDIKKKFNIDKVNYVVSCVVPIVYDNLKQALKKHMNKGFFVDYKSYEGISKLLDPPEEIGSDLVAASVEAIERYSQPTIIVDMGTASKIIVVNDNTIIGVAILLGVKKTRNAIVKSIPHLPKVKLDFPKNIVGQNTIESIQSGIMFSTTASINGYSDLIEKYFNQKVKKIITGGMSSLFVKELDDYIYEENLVSEGLFTLYKINEKKGMLS